MKTKNLILILIVMSLAALLSCAHTPGINTQQTLNEKVQTQEFAQYRRNQIENVSYKLFIDITEAANIYKGAQFVSFGLKSAADVMIEFQEGNVTLLEINGLKAAVERGPVYLKLPKEFLLAGDNKVKIEFTHEYSKSGSGLHLFKDPEDQNTYMYTDFEPFDASRWAPFFDQPDIKAPLELTVKAPSKMKVIANTNAKIVSPGRDDAKGTTLWVFEKTAPISTYVYAMMAGPFVEWQSSYKNIPLKLYARQTLAKYVRHEEWFQITKQGFEFFENYFGVAYPFGKYDQVHVPEFNSGAMENVGAVTFSERYIKRGTYTRTDKLRFYNTVLHELAHMWFGNLVTMKWWNDLWLNESFATYMAALSQVSATQYKEAWVDMREDKEGAIQLDQTIVTHPISGAVKNSNEAFAAFDDITYGKGASVMKELSLYLGANIFQQSLQEYFKTHVYKNTTLNDFIAAFEKTTLLKLKPWFESWLETTGVDTVTQSFLCEGHDLTVSLNFTAKSRPHALQVAAYKKSSRGLDLVKVLNFKTAEGQTETSIKVTGTKEAPEPCPDFIFANHNDQSYVKVEFDEKSIAFLEKNILLLDDTIFKLSVWSNLWHMVRDQKLKLARFSNMALSAIEKETNIDLLNFLSEKTVGRRWGEFDSVYYFWPQDTAAEKALYETVTQSYEEAIHKRLKSAKGDLKFIFEDMYFFSVNSARGAKNVLSILEASVDPDIRWRAIHTLCREGHESCEDLVVAELEKDKSDTAIKNALGSRSARPDAAYKKEIISQLTAEKMNYSADEVDKISRNIFPAKQRAMLDKYKKQIYEAVHEKWPKLETSFQRDLAFGMAPLFCQSSASTEFSDKIMSDKTLPASMADVFSEIFDNDRRCIAIRNYNRQ
jgi:aminopeptidase N